MNGYGNPADAQANFQFQPPTGLQGIIQNLHQASQQDQITGGTTNLAKAIAELMKKKNLDQMAQHLNSIDPSALQGAPDISGGMYS